MSCNGCRILRKGCSDTCILRPCLQWIESPEAQGHATVFVAKFFGRAGLVSFISAVPENQRPALFQSLLFEACGRTVNPVTGAVGLLWTGNWHVCQAAVETILRGGALRPMPELLVGGGLGLGEEGPRSPASDEASEAEVACTDMWKLQNSHSRFSNSGSKVSPKLERIDEPIIIQKQQQLQFLSNDLDLRLTPNFSPKTSPKESEVWQPGTPSMNSEESVTTTTMCPESQQNENGGERKLLNLFV